MYIAIHCTRQQIAFLGATLGKIHLERDGTKTISVEKWVQNMYQAAKNYEHIHSYNYNGKMRTYHSHPQVIKENKR